MAEYIEREVPKERITAEKDSHDTDTPYWVGYNNGLTMAYAMVVAMPAADVEVVKHGRWEERPVNVGTCTTGLFCSECNFPSLGWRYNYCPNCGAKMDLEVTNGLDQH